MFRDGGKYVNGKPVSLGKVDRFELNPRFHQPGHESDIPGQPVQLSYDQGGSVESARGKCLREPWAVIPTAAFDFGVFGD
jgi:hypothetical protein